jgi:hypothetical protein
MIVEISDDVAEEIVSQALLQDYLMLTEDLAQPEKMHEDDVEAFTETIKHIEGLCLWYFAPGEFDKLVKKARKKK